MPAVSFALPLGAFALAATAFATMASVAPSHAEPASGPPHTSASYESEVARIRIHFDSVLHELRAADIAHLSAAQRAERATRIADLAAYRDRGVFPHNHDFADGWMPYFVDHRGVLCAVAHLLELSGRRDIVDRVADVENNVWVAALAGDREFEGWLRASGLTLAEAARIQVPYIETPNESVSASRSNRINSAAAITAGGLGVATMILNTRDPASGRAGLRSALGYTAGALGLAIAASRMEADGTPLAIGAATGVIGVGSAIMATRTLLGSREAARASASAAAAESERAVELSIAPSVQATGSKLSPALALNLRF